MPPCKCPVGEHRTTEGFLRCFCPCCCPGEICRKEMKAFAQNLKKQLLLVGKVRIESSMGVVDAISDLAQRHTAPAFRSSNLTCCLQNTPLQFLLLSLSSFFAAHIY